MSSKFTGIYVGLVVDNDDPKKLGRLKISVPSVYGNIEKEDLPWSEPCFPYGYTDQGIFFIPELNSLVSVMFINGSPYKPLWLGTIFRENENVVPSEAKDIYPDRKIIKTNSGYLMFDDDSQYIELKHRSGSRIAVTKDGDITIHAAHDVVILADHQIIMDLTNKEQVIPLKYIKSHAELNFMSANERASYQAELEDYNIKVNTNCGDQSNTVYQRSSTGGPSLGNKCKSQSV
ncbi:MAG TPA: phage baseplate assembly protein V, partial [Bacilli bacterium]|nr:phage baseplate assembly protein V [Bacilli bacterium]